LEHSDLYLWHSGHPILPLTISCFGKSRFVIGCWIFWLGRRKNWTLWFFFAVSDNTAPVSAGVLVADTLWSRPFKRKLRQILFVVKPPPRFLAFPPLLTEPFPAILFFPSFSASPPRGHPWGVCSSFLLFASSGRILHNHLPMWAGLMEGYRHVGLGRGIVSQLATAFLDFLSPEIIGAWDDR